MKRLFLKNRRSRSRALLIIALSSLSLQAADRTYGNAAQQAALWIRSHAIKTEQGAVWPADPNDKKTIDTNLYSGTPGVVLFFLEAYRSTGDKSYLDDAR